MGDGDRSRMAPVCDKFATLPAPGGLQLDDDALQTRVRRFSTRQVSWSSLPLCDYRTQILLHALATMTAATRSASATPNCKSLLSLDQLSLSRPSTSTSTGSAPAIVPAGGEEGLEEDADSLPALSQPSSVASSEDGEEEYTGPELQARAMEAATALLSQFLGGQEVELDHGQRKWRSRSVSSKHRVPRDRGKADSVHAVLLRRE